MYGIMNDALFIVLGVLGVTLLFVLFMTVLCLIAKLGGTNELPEYFRELGAEAKSTFFINTVKGSYRGFRFYANTAVPKHSTTVSCDFRMYYPAPLELGLYMTQKRNWIISRLHAPFGLRGRRIKDIWMDELDVECWARNKAKAEALLSSAHLRRQISALFAHSEYNFIFVTDSCITMRTMNARIPDAKLMDMLCETCNAFATYPMPQILS